MDWLIRTRKTSHGARSTQRGNAIMMVFMAIGMAGVVTYGLNTIMRGPAVTAAESSRRTIAANNLVATTRLAITAATRQQSNNGDCDSDGFVEPMPFRAPTTEPVPVGGGLIPMSVGASMTDPWGNQYGYCVWDPGTVSKSDAFAGCGGAGANRLQGAPRDDQPAIAVISAGKNGVFETGCNAYVDTTPADNKPDTPLVDKPGTSDDVVLSYTYAEANGVGGGLWKISQDPLKPNTAEIGMNIKSTSTGGATFSGKVELKNKGLVLPGDPGDDTVTGPCDAAKDGQLRRNTSTSPATIEMCDNSNGNGWVQISGAAAAGGPFNPEKSNCTANEGGPLFKVAELGGGETTTQIWSKVGSSSQTLFVASGTDGINALRFDGTTFTWLDGFNDGSAGQWAGVWGDDNYIYANSRWTEQRLVALSFNGSTFSQVGNRLDSGGNLHALWGDGTYIYMSEDYASATANVGAYTFNGTNFVLKDKAFTWDPWDSWGDGTAIYAANAYYDPVATSWDGNTFGTQGEATGSGGASAVWGYGGYIFYAHWTGGLKAYTFDGTNFVEIASIDNSIDFQDVWSDGVYIYTATNGDGLRVYTFDGTNFTYVSAYTGDTDGQSVWGDGNYIYYGTQSGKIIALGGFACTSPDPDGGSTPPASSGGDTGTTGGLKTLPDLLDNGLVSYWKFDGPQGQTTIKDYVGENDGTVVNLAAHGLGQTTDGGYTFDSIDDDGIMIPGLLGEQADLTIAGWVNISDYTYQPGNTDGATIFSIGDYVTLVDYYDDLAYDNGGLSLLYYVGGGWWVYLQAPSSIAGSGWHYVSATIDTTTDPSNKVARLYMDGVKIAEGIPPASIDYSGLGNNTYFGMHANGGDAEMSGSVDDFRFYNRALSSGEIADLYKRESINGIHAPSIVAAPLLATKSMKLAAGTNLTCAIKNDGSPWCWGRDNIQQLGNGGSGSSDPSQVSPSKVLEPTYQAYYLTGTASDLGGSIKKLSLHLETPRANTGAIAALSTVSIFGATPASSPGIDDGSGARPYTVTVSTTAPHDCITASVNVRRINAAGTIQTIKTLGTTQRLNATTTTFSGDIDLGTFAATDRIATEMAFTETCNSAVAAFDVWGELRTPLQDRSPWTSITSSLNDTHSCGIKANGSAWCWGWDGDYALGNSGFASGLYSEPSRVVDTGAPWTSISVGANHTCAIQSNGTLWCWGTDADGQLGNGAATGLQAQPSQVGTDTDWAQVAAGYANFTCAVKTNGTLWCWGDDTNGQLGNGSSPSADQISPYLVPDPGPWQKVSAGGYHACGLKTDGSLWCWGLNSYYALGSMSGTSYLPIKVTNHPDNWVDVSAGFWHTCGIDRTGTAWCWGAGGARLGGYNISGNTQVPRRVYALSDVAGIAAGNDHTCAMKTDGSLWCWGVDAYGQLGNGSGLTADQFQPTPVEGFSSLPTWVWDSANSIIRSGYGQTVGLGTGYLSDTTSRGFGFSSPGRARLTQNNDSNQLLLNATASNVGSQLSFQNETGLGVLDVTSGLVGKWPLDTNGNATVGASVNGTVGGGAQFDSARYKIGTGAAVFDGNDDYIQVPRAALEEPTYLSVSFWMRRAGNQLPGDETVVLAKLYKNRTATPYVSYMFSLFGQRLQFTTGHTSDTRDFILTDIPDEQWVFVTGTYNKDASGIRKKLYINGELKAYSSVNTLIKYDTNSTTGRLYFGGRSGDVDGFVGALDDVRIYNRQLSDAEVRQLYNFYQSTAQTTRSMGIDYANDQFEIGRNVAGATNFLNTINPDIAITAGGNVGVGLGAGTAAAKLDVGGGVRFGSEETCDTNRVGAMRYTGGTPPWSYCNGTAWVAIPGVAPLLWQKFISAGGQHTCGLKSDGAGWCWGSANSGRIGDNQSSTDRLTPVSVHDNASPAGWNDWAQISASSNGHTCGIRANGTAWCWGYSGAGQLGDNQTAANRTRPVQVHTDVSSSGWSDWVQISTGFSHTCGIRANGTAWCWGLNIDGQLGNNLTTSASRPVQVHSDVSSTGWTDWIQISVGDFHACGIRANGTMWCWGRASNGQIGDNQTTARLRPVQVHSDVSSTGWSDWVKVSAGGESTCGIRTDGTAWCWGRPSGGKLGDNQSATSRLRPVQVHSDVSSTGWSDWLKIKVGTFHTCGIRTNGTAWCWGYAANGRLGDNQSGTDRLRPVQVHSDVSSTGWSDWAEISTGFSHSCGVRTNGTAWCWGAAANGRLGDNQSGTDRLRPVQVQ